MKKLITLLCCVTTIICFFCTTISAEQERDYNVVKITHEPEMPKKEDENYKRSDWIEKVKEINESTYDQKISNVLEDEDYIIFEFEMNEESKYKKVVIDNIEYVNVQIDKIMYLKPESRLYVTSSKSTSTKIVEYYGWSSGYSLYKKKSGQFGSIINLLIGYIPTQSVFVSWVLSEAVGDLYDSIVDSASVEAKTFNKYYYRNRCGCVYNSIASAWLPIAQVGERRTFGLCFGSVPNEYGEPIPVYGPETNANNSTNPTNYHGREKKSHYDDTSWIINKAIETQSTGGYADIYGICTRQ